MNNIKDIAKIAVFMLLAVGGFYACEEGERFGVSSDDTTPPEPPVFDTVHALPGGARIFYKLPADKDVLSIEASFTATNGKLIKSAVSLFAPYLEIFGLPDTLEHTLHLYALDRAGNKSKVQDVKVTPLEPTYSKVANSLEIHPAFGAFMLAWENELKQDVNIFVDFSFSDNGVNRSIRQVFSSVDSVERKFIKGLNLPESETVTLKITVEDLYGNRMEKSDIEPLHLKTDEQLKKEDWLFPLAGTLIGGVGMSNGNCYYGNIKYLNDGNCNDVNHPGQFAFFNVQYNDPANNIKNDPFNVMIDLGDKYVLSRIVTHQRRYWDPASLATNPRGNYYLDYNVGIYNMYYWDGNDEATVGTWKLINRIKIPMPSDGMTDLEIVYQAELGDESMMYPEKPDFTPATRWFRYEVVAPFLNNYGTDLSQASCLAELTLYGRKAQ
ncbi:hypothetical protein FACS189430_10450 [Bacteroidia bacterium]|nr:hypothetical protein FACS189430_10450 [Bacteroidia bacterium]